MQRFYIPDINSDTIQLDEEESKHCIRVLRMQTGDELELTDGKGMEATAVITDANPKRCLLHIQNRKQTTPPRNYRLHLAVAPTKNMERMEWLLEKAVECGVDQISFLTTSRSERNRINMDRCLKIAISAMKQSHQNHLPVLHEPVPYNTWMSDSTNSGMIAVCDYPNRINLPDAIANSQTNDFIVVIGPEGDFTPDELEFALNKGFIPVSLGESVLRSETAALFACMSVKAIRSLDRKS